MIWVDERPRHGHEDRHADENEGHHDQDRRHRAPPRAADERPDRLQPQHRRANHRTARTVSLARMENSHANSRDDSMMRTAITAA